MMCLNLKPYKSWLVNRELALECGPGWNALIEDALENIGAVMVRYPGQRLKVKQIKEKLGGLRLYYELNPKPATDTIYTDLRRVIEAAEVRSFETCEICGAAGKLRQTDFGWLRVSCDGHAEPDSIVIG